MARWDGQPYRYNRAEWWGVFLALLATPAFLFVVLFDRASVSTSGMILVALLCGALALAGWTLLIVGRRAHLRAERGPSA